MEELYLIRTNLDSLAITMNFGVHPKIGVAWWTNLGFIFRSDSWHFLRDHIHTKDFEGIKSWGI